MPCGPRQTCTLQRTGMRVYVSAISAALNNILMGSGRLFCSALQRQVLARSFEPSSAREHHLAQSVAGERRKCISRRCVLLACHRASSAVSSSSSLAPVLSFSCSLSPCRAVHSGSSSSSSSSSTVCCGPTLAMLTYPDTLQVDLSPNGVSWCRGLCWTSLTRMGQSTSTQKTRYVA